MELILMLATSLISSIPATFTLSLSLYVSSKVSVAFLCRLMLTADGARYVWVYILVIKSFLVYISDIYTATTMLTSDNWSNKIFESCKEKSGCVAIPFGVAKWLFVGCIIFSFLLVSMIAKKSIIYGSLFCV